MRKNVLIIAIGVVSIAIILIAILSIKRFNADQQKSTREPKPLPSKATTFDRWENLDSSGKIIGSYAFYGSYGEYGTLGCFLQFDATDLYLFITGNNNQSILSNADYYSIVIQRKALFENEQRLMGVFKPFNGGAVFDREATKLFHDEYSIINTGGIQYAYPHTTAEILSFFKVPGVYVVDVRMLNSTSGGISFPVREAIPADVYNKIK